MAFHYRVNKFMKLKNEDIPVTMQTPETIMRGHSGSVRNDFGFQ
jgi:hypothetical protein